jgi:hypothetical protein
MVGPLPLARLAKLAAQEAQEQDDTCEVAVERRSGATQTRGSTTRGRWQHGPVLRCLLVAAGAKEGGAA